MLKKQLRFKQIREGIQFSTLAESQGWTQYLIDLKLDWNDKEQESMAQCG